MLVVDAEAAVAESGGLLLYAEPGLRHEPCPIRISKGPSHLGITPEGAGGLAGGRSFPY